MISEKSSSKIFEIFVFLAISGIFIWSIFPDSEQPRFTGLITKDKNHEIIFVSETRGYLKTLQPPNVPNENITYSVEPEGKYSVKSARLGMPLEFDPLDPLKNSYMCIQCSHAQLEGLWFLENKNNKKIE